MARLIPINRSFLHKRHGGHIKLHDDVRDLKAASFPGMAHFGKSGPESVTCRQCSRYVVERDSHGCVADTAYKIADDNLKDGRCSKYAEMMRLSAGPTFPHTAPGCKYFVAQEADAIPAMLRSVQFADK
jgi:hypothetical protein